MKVALVSSRHKLLVLSTGGHCLGQWPVLLWQWPELGSEVSAPQMEKTDVPSAGAQGSALLWGFSILSAFNPYWGESISFTIVFT